MRVITKDEFQLEKEEIKQKILDGAVFIHPTDTIYGIGCNATDPDAVKKVRDAKHRPNRPFSVIAPSKEWIQEHCELTEQAKEHLKKLPGPYTLILKLKKKILADDVAPGMDTVGVRIPNHWISSFVRELGIPVVTTSANIIGGDFMTSLDDLDSKVGDKMDFILYEGEKKGSPSKIIDVAGKLMIIER